MLIPLIVACALFMENLDSTAIATALPVIAAAFGESPVRLSLAITSYLFSLAVFIPISGWVADRFGARRVFRLAIGVFVLGSILCGFTTSVWQLVLARTLQGLGGAMMVPVGRLVLLRATAKADLVRAMAWLTIPALIGPVLGPPLGGFITTYVSWRWIFWINVPIGVLGIVLVSLFIPDVREERPPPLDLRGFLLSSVGLLGLVAGFESIGRGLVPPGFTLLLLVAGALGVGAVRAACQADPSRRDRPRPARGADLPRLRGRRLPVPDRHRRDPVPVAADVAGGVRAQRLQLGPAHFCRGGRGDAHEGHRAADPQAVRLQARADRERADQQRLHRRERLFQPTTPHLLILGCCWPAASSARSSSPASTRWAMPTSSARA